MGLLNYLIRCFGYSENTSLECDYSGCRKKITSRRVLFNPLRREFYHDRDCHISQENQRKKENPDYFPNLSLARWISLPNARRKKTTGNLKQSR